MRSAIIVRERQRNNALQSVNNILSDRWDDECETKSKHDYAGIQGVYL